MARIMEHAPLTQGVPLSDSENVPPTNSGRHSSVSGYASLVGTRKRASSMALVGAQEGI